MNYKAASLLFGTVVLLAVLAWPVPAQKGQPAPKGERPPHGQSTLPGPALSPAEAIKKMTVRPGFHVELVAAEPAIVNPVAMTFDERGRIWITESIEYPRRSAGPGKDRVKLLESTKGDGKFDKITTVIDGLNIPSGIAVGHGGVWVANSPDLLFYPIEDFAAPRLGKPQVVVTGFGRDDTHELPNSLTWGPDGWLYGLNGVFNQSHVKHKGKDYKFTCALFRIHPKTKDFEIFCEGTSNPWGLAFNENGDAFVSACVIDHLWHLTETGYYHRQGGPYPPYTWKIGSIVKHRHQQAAYCGLVWFDSDAYPPEYRGKLFMGNIHGNCINSDELTRDGSTYFAKPRPDFLTANDAWFMPVSQKVGPDGCMYILDWYDRYHCYQDANRDPAGIDRVHGRLYRVVYKDYKAAGKFDMSKESTDQLIARLHSPNIFYRDLAQRLLCERFPPDQKLNKQMQESRYKLAGMIDDQRVPRKTRMHALWTFISTPTVNEIYTIDMLLESKDDRFRAWGVRTVAQTEALQSRATIAASLASDPSPVVQLQVAIAARKLKPVDPLPVLLDVITHCGDDQLIPHIVWQNLYPLLEKDGERFLSLASKADLAKAPGLAKVLPRAIDRILGNPSGDPAAVVKFIDKLTTEGKTEPAKLCLTALTVKIQNNEIAGKQLDAMRNQIKPRLKELAADAKSPLAFEATLLSASLKDVDGLTAAAAFFSNREKREAARIRALGALVTAGETFSVMRAMSVFSGESKTTSLDFRGQILSTLSKLEYPEVAGFVLQHYAKMEPELQPKAIELLTQRPTWAKSLFKEIAAKRISKDVINVNQARRLLGTKDTELTKLIKKHWGVPRDSRNPDRERIVAEMRTVLTKQRGDPQAGWKVFKNVCGQCHKIYGEGVDVGPDITSNGRSDFNQLLSNVFDPSLVIGAGYQATTVATSKGQVLTGLVVEDNAQHVVLKTQGGKLETIPRGEVETMSVSQVSLMPEGLEKQLRPQELADLFAFLTLDRPPGDPRAKLIPGTPR
jgi:putative membrane-bound dehydrogenase-like protein